MRFLVQISVLLLFFSVVARGDALPLPVSTALDCTWLEIDMRGGRIDVVIDPDAEEPSLEATDYVDSGAERGFVVLEPGANGALRVGQAYGEDAVAPRVLLRLVLHPDQRLTIKGSDLAISIEDVRGLAAGEDDAGAIKVVSGSAGAPDALELSPNDSDVHLSGVRGATLGGQRTHYRLERTHGQIRAQLKRGTLESAFHRGGIDVTASDTDISVSALAGGLTARQDGGAVVIHGGGGTLDLTIDQPNACTVSGFSGAISLNVKHGGARIDHAGTAESLVSILAAQADIEIEDLAGGANLQLVDGRLKLQRIQGQAVISAQGSAVLELREMRDVVDLRTQDGVNSEAHAILKRFTVRVRDGKLKAETLADLDLVANNAEVTVQAVSIVSRLDLNDSEADLDIRGAQGFPTLKLTGHTRARLELRDPCLVRIDGDVEALRNQLQVDGCELMGEREPSPSMGRRIAAQPPQIITVNLGNDAELAVRANP